ncbi:MAG: hypothetical protein LBE24_05415 [Methylobacillus sp.]|jgi:hypothetical protein|nr:hypothetical protein [Methylobacillus sp.]
METYIGIDLDTNGGLTHLGRIVMDGWLFDLIPESETCAGWNAAQMQNLYEKVYAAWEPHAHLPGQLPPALREKHARIYEAAMERGRNAGWNPELGEDE